MLQRAATDITWCENRLVTAKPPQCPAVTEAEGGRRDSAAQGRVAAASPHMRHLVVKAVHPYRPLLAESWDCATAAAAKLKSPNLAPSWH